MAAADARDRLHDRARDVLAGLPAGRLLITAVTLLGLLVARLAAAGPESGRCPLRRPREP
jgi:hypothetical protein